MYNEIVRIIEAGMALDTKKVQSYAKLLAENLQKSGDIGFADKISRILSDRRQSLATLDSLGAKPVDGESRLDIVDVSYPTCVEDDYVFGEDVEKMIASMIASYARREELLRAGVGNYNTLLLYGPPGCGKTSLANLIASRMGLPLVTARLDTLVSSLLGSTAKNIRKVFEFASRKRCVLFLDEFDAIAKMRDDRNELGELKRVVNGLLQEIDIFSPESVLVAATNHHKMLDPAVWRRFGLVFKVGLPDEEQTIRLFLRLVEGRNGEGLSSKKHISYLKSEFKGCSHSAITTIVRNAIKESVLSGHTSLDYVDVLKAIYIYKNHSISNEDEFVAYLLTNGVTTRKLFTDLGYKTRRVREISKDLNNEKHPNQAC